MYIYQEFMINILSLPNCHSVVWSISGPNVGALSEVVLECPVSRGKNYIIKQFLGRLY